jgi:hypothetical protein
MTVCDSTTRGDRDIGTCDRLSWIHLEDNLNRNTQVCEKYLKSRSRRLLLRHTARLFPHQNELS